MDYEQMARYDEGTVPSPYVRRTPRGHWLEAWRVVDPALLEWLDANLEKGGEHFGDSPVDPVHLLRVARAA